MLEGTRTLNKINESTQKEKVARGGNRTRGPGVAASYYTD